MTAFLCIFMLPIILTFPLKANDNDLATYIRIYPENIRYIMLRLNLTDTLGNYGANDSKGLTHR